VLDALTDVDVLKHHPTSMAQGSIEADGMWPPAYACDALVLGSGTAGGRAAVELKRHGIDVVVATQNLYGGTSACSGSYKQTCIRPRPAAMAMISSHLPQPSALAAPWTKTPPMWKRSDRCARCRRYNISGCPSRSIGWERCSGIKRIMAKPGARQVAVPGRLD
jgi:FAD binding domain